MVILAEFISMKKGPDHELIRYVDVANVACGFHAGDPSLMIKTVRLAKEHGVKVGAHPGLNGMFPRASYSFFNRAAKLTPKTDLFGFGRRQMVVDPADMYAMILCQVGALKAILDAEGVPLNHIKPHGELFFYMQRDLKICRAVLEACAVFEVPVYGAKGADDEKAICDELGIAFIEEAYVDTEYTKDKKLVPIALIKMASPEDIYNRIMSIGSTILPLISKGRSWCWDSARSLLPSVFILTCRQRWRT